MIVVTGPPPDGDVNRGNAITIIMWVEFSIALVLILSRIFSRTRLNRSWGWDDAFMCFAMQYLIIIAASIPTLGPLVNALLKRTSSSSPYRSNHPLSRISGRPNHERSRGGRNRSRSGKMILTSTNAQVYPLSEYKGWIGPNGINGSGGSDEAILPSQNIEPGCIMKTMEIRVSSRGDDRSESDISLSPELSNEV
ncbi:hypothetical protein CIHG_06947 [Coccidioides immitis H538.4]|uniref:Integral membrane protein n=1 Tax=Coccidioides immitis H538.4 TaxID=396776 RepID=A0A0J8RXG5_COCIT|nr:hypothetical protein CIHG_06947 [Coccidioides immitis H538.4]